MKTKSKKIGLLILALVIAVSPIANVNAGYDEDYVIIEYDNMKPTNEDVVLNFEITDEGDNGGIGSGVDKLVHLNGDSEEDIDLEDSEGIKTGKFEIQEDGEYRFKAYDIAGNQTLAKVTISNIDKEAPTLTLSPSTEDFTNKSVIITAKASDEKSGVDKIKLPDGNEIEKNEATFEVSENGKYKFIAVDKAGNEFEEEIEITNISNAVPTITVNYDDDEQEWTNDDIEVTASAKDSEGAELDVDPYIFTENGSHTFTVTDKWGNKATAIVNVTKIDKTKPNIKITIK